MPRSRAASALSTTSAAAPMPMIMPWRRRSNGSGGLLDHFVGGGRAAGQEAGADPLEQMVGGDVVGRDDDHAAAAPGADPVLGQRHGLGGARAGRVDLRVRPAGADEFGELRVAHRQDAEQEAAVEDCTAPSRARARSSCDAPVDLLAQDGLAVRPRPCGRAGPRARPAARGGRGPRSSASSRRRRSRSRGRPRRRSRRCRRAARRAAPSGRAAACPWWWSCSACTSGMPASRSASMPAPIASCVSRSSAAIALGGDAELLSRSKAPPRGRPA